MSIIFWLDGGSLSGKSEDSGSQFGFFISDEDVNMAEEMPTSLQAYIEITESTYEKVHPGPQSDIQPVDPEAKVQLLNNWCRKLCAILAEYTNIQNSQSASDSTKILLKFKKFCPWKMSQKTRQMSSELLELCIRDHCCDALSHYCITPLADLTGPLVECLVDLKPDDSVIIQPLDSVFLSAFWFLVDQSRMLDFISELVESDIGRSRRLWRTYINCLLSKHTSHYVNVVDNSNNNVL